MFNFYFILCPIFMCKCDGIACEIYTVCMYYVTKILSQDRGGVYLAYFMNGRNSQLIKSNEIFISRGAEGPGREILQRRPSVCLSVRPSVCLSVCLSVTFSFRTVTQKRIDVFSRNFACMCTMSWGCAV